jgi:hypothetical protein
MDLGLFDKKLNEDRESVSEFSVCHFDRADAKIKVIQPGPATDCPKRGL